MATWAEIIDGKAANVVTADPTTCFPADWLAKNPPFIIVPDGTKHGRPAEINQDQSITWGDNPTPPPPQPNNQNNPYFGKAKLPVGKFWGLVSLVYIAMANDDNGVGLDRLSRLTTSKRAANIIQVINGQDLIDTDDSGGNFLRFLTILTTTNHETDGKLLMELAEAAAIMQAWT